MEEGIGSGMEVYGGVWSSMEGYGGVVRGREGYGGVWSCKVVNRGAGRSRKVYCVVGGGVWRCREV